MRRLQVKRKQTLVLAALLGAVLALMFLLGKCSRQAPAAQTLHPELAKSGGDTLDVAIEISPMLYSTSGDSVSGIDYELMQAIAERAGRPVVFHPFAPLEYALAGLEEGVFDVVISALPATGHMRDRFLLTEPVYLDREILVQRKDAAHRIERAEDLADDTVWIASGSPYKQRIANLADEIGDTIYVVEQRGHTAEHLLMLVARGELPRAVVSEGVARRMQAEFYPELDVDVPVSFRQFQTWAIRRDNKTMCDSINAWLGDVKASQQYTTLLRRYGLPTVR